MLDTNVLLSALLTPHGLPAQVLMLTLAGELTLLFDERVLDRPFVEVALSGDADALVTGNARDFPPDLGIAVLSPRGLLELIEPQ